MWTKEQSEAIAHSSAGVLLTAAAGSGKTSVLTQFYIELVKGGLSTSQILLLTFTRESAKELKKRILKSENNLTMKMERPAFITTFHGFCHHLLGSWSKKPIQKILFPFHEEAIFVRAFDAIFNTLSKESSRELLQYFSLRDLHGLFREAYAKRNEVEPGLENLSTIPPLPLVKDLISQFYAYLDQETIQKGQFSFSDLEREAIKLLKESPDIREHYRKKFKKILVDEFQDTSQAQWDFLSFLTENDHKKLFLVGDPKQSIYRFRKADLTLFLALSESFREKLDFHQLNLTANFRSQPELIQTFNNFSAKLFEPEIKFEPMVAAVPEAFDGACVFHHEFHENEGEIKETVRHLPELISKKEKVAFLFRVSDKILFYEQILQEEGYATQSFIQLPFLSSCAVQRLVQFIESLKSNPPFLSLLGFYLKNTSDLLLQTPESSAALLTLMEKNPHFSPFFKLRESPPLLAKALEIYFSDYEPYPSHHPTLDSLVTSLLEEPFTLEEGITLLNVWKKTGLKVSYQKINPEAQVFLMTVHASKGLEFDHVFLVDLSRLGTRAYPWILSNKNQMHIRVPENESEAYQKELELERASSLEESKRLFYVAMTRAKKSLHFFVPKDKEKLPKNSWGHWVKTEREKCQNQN